MATALLTATEKVAAAIKLHGGIDNAALAAQLESNEHLGALTAHLESIANSLPALLMGVRAAVSAALARPAAAPVGSGQAAGGSAPSAGTASPPAASSPASGATPGPASPPAAASQPAASGA